MADVYLYADETGDMDMSGSQGASNYFGFGTALFAGDHGAALWEGLSLRFRLEAAGVKLPQGLHAKNDSHSSRDEMFSLIAKQKPRFDTTFLLKKNARDYVKAAGPMRLYKLAWYLHFKYVAPRVSSPGDTLYVVAASLKTSRRTGNAHAALSDVCDQFARARKIVLCTWDASSSWGVQVADYALWATQRDLEGRPCSWYDTHVEPYMASRFCPWGTL